MQTLPEERHIRIRELEDIPALPTVAQAVLEELGRDDVHINRLAALIERDPGLTARIVGVANSAYFGCSDRVYTVSDAILKVLGLNLVKSLTYSIVLSGPLKTTHCPGFKLDEYWYVAVMTASLARRMISHMPQADRTVLDNAYLCGLMHNFGVLVLAYAFPKELGQLLSEGHDWGEDAFVERQQQMLGLTHTEAGVILGRRWHLPSGVINTIEHHSNPAYAGDQAVLVHLIGLCAKLAIEDFRGDEIPQVPAEALASLDLAPEAALQTLHDVHEQREELRSLARLLALD